MTEAGEVKPAQFVGLGARNSVCIYTKENNGQRYIANLISHALAMYAIINGKLQTGLLQENNLVKGDMKINQ